MPRWILPAVAGVGVCVSALLLLEESARAFGIPLRHYEAFIDANGEYREGGSTRPGFLSVLAALFAGGWAAGAVNTRRLDCSLSGKEWSSVGAIFGGLTAYVVIMHFLTVTFGRETAWIPDFLFGVLDLGILVGCGYVAYRVYNRRMP